MKPNELHRWALLTTATGLTLLVSLGWGFLRHGSTQAKQSVIQGALVVPVVFEVDEVVLADDVSVRIPITNPTKHMATVTSIRSSCGCAEAEMIAMKLQPGATEWLNVDLISPFRQDSPLEYLGTANRNTTIDVSWAFSDEAKVHESKISLHATLRSPVTIDGGHGFEFRLRGQPTHELRRAFTISLENGLRLANIESTDSSSSWAMESHGNGTVQVTGTLGAEVLDREAVRPRAVDLHLQAGGDPFIARVPIRLLRESLLKKSPEAVIFGPTQIGTQHNESVSVVAVEGRLRSLRMIGENPSDWMVELQQPEANAGMVTIAFESKSNGTFSTVASLDAEIEMPDGRIEHDRVRLPLVAVVQ